MPITPLDECDDAFRLAVRAAVNQYNADMQAAGDDLEAQLAAADRLRQALLDAQVARVDCKNQE